MRKMTVSMSHGRGAILHDVRKEISANVDTNLGTNNEIFCDKLRDYNYSVEAYTNAKFQPCIDAYNVGKKKSRQIHETYTEHVAKENEKLIKKAEENKLKGIKANVRKPTQLCHEYVLQIGNRETNGTLDTDIEMNREYCREILKQIQEKYPHCDVLLATFHGDEPNGTPHMHINVQFTGEGYEKGLNQQISISKALELDGFERSNNRGDYAINRWTNDVQESIMAPELAKLGIEREVLGEHRQHEDIRFFREKAKEEVRALEEVRTQAKNELQEIKTEGQHLVEQNNSLRETSYQLQEGVQNLKFDKNSLEEEKMRIQAKIEELKPMAQEVSHLESKKVELTGQIDKLDEKIQSGRQELQRNAGMKEFLKTREELVNMDVEIKKGRGGKTVTNLSPEQVESLLKTSDAVKEQIYSVTQRKEQIMHEGYLRGRESMKPELQREKDISAERLKQISALQNENATYKSILAQIPEHIVSKAKEIIRELRKNIDHTHTM